MNSEVGHSFSPDSAIIVAAAGRGERFKSNLPKALEVVAGRTILAHCLASLDGVTFDAVVLVTSPATHVQEVTDICAQFPTLAPIVVPGGTTRTASVLAALDQLPAGIEFVFVHDAARAFTPASVFTRVRAELDKGAKGVVPVLPPRDTLKEVAPDGSVVRTVDRTAVRSVQTPQGFRRAQLDAAYVDIDALDATDDAGLMERAGHSIGTVLGDPRAFKVTDPFDRYVAQAVLAVNEQSGDRDG